MNGYRRVRQCEWLEKRFCLAFAISVDGGTVSWEGPLIDNADTISTIGYHEGDTKITWIDDDGAQSWFFPVGHGPSEITTIHIFGRGDEDTINLQDIDATFFQLESVIVYGGDDDDTIRLPPVAAFCAELDDITCKAIGNDGADTIIGNSAPDEIHGGTPGDVGEWIETLSGGACTFGKFLALRLRG